MRKYHYTDGTNTFGPFAIEELRTKRITADTYVWTEGMRDWVPAKSFPELNDILSEEAKPYFTSSHQSPPRLPSAAVSSYPGQMQAPPKTYLLETILTTIFCCWPLGIPSIVYASRVEKKFYAGDTIGAERDSARAKKWMWINVGACIALWMLYFLVFGFAMFGAVMSSSF